MDYTTDNAHVARTRLIRRSTVAAVGVAAVGLAGTGFLTASLANSAANSTPQITGTSSGNTGTGNGGSTYIIGDDGVKQRVSPNAGQGSGTVNQPGLGVPAPGTTVSGGSNGS